MSLWSPDTGGHNDLHPFPPRRRDTATAPPGPNLPAKATSPDLFPPSLLPASTLAALPEGYTMRPLAPSDYSKGHLETLKALTSVGEISQASWEERWRWMKRRNDLDLEEGRTGAGEGQKAGGEYFVIVVCDTDGRLVGTGTVVAERKFIHNLGLVGHIEDIVVRKDQQGKKLGLRIIEALDHVAKEVGCYKAILDCSDTNEGFYVKCGYKRVGLEMAHYYDK